MLAEGWLAQKSTFESTVQKHAHQENICPYNLNISLTLFPASASLILTINSLEFFRVISKITYK